MNLQQQLKADMVSAMKEKNQVKVTAVKSLVAGMINELAAAGREDRENLTDEEVMSLIKRGVKQRKDSIDQFTNGGRPELAESEQAELVILEAYLPAAMSQADIKEIAMRVKSETGIDDKSKIGVLIGAVMKETQGQADGGDVKDVVMGLFD